MRIDVRLGSGLARLAAGEELAVITPVAGG